MRSKLLRRQPERQNIRSGANGKVLLAVKHVGHRRSFPVLVGLEMPLGKLRRVVNPPAAPCGDRPAIARYMSKIGG
jgi:hypothetical protein